MIYNCQVRNSLGETKTFFLTADNYSQLYRRIASTYRIAKYDVEILEEYEETSDWKYKLVKSNIAHISDEDKELNKKASDLYSNASRKSEPYKSEAMKKYKYDVVPIEKIDDIVPLLKSYKKVKVYWELGEKRGQHKYYAFVK